MKVKAATMINPMTLVAGSGIVALVMAGWSQVKTIARYLMAFAVIRARLDEQLSWQAQIYMRKTYKILPSGLFIYVHRYIKVRTQKSSVVVPFRVLGGNIVFYSGWRVAIMNFTGEKAMILTIRGMFNFEDIIRQSLLYYGERTAYRDGNESRYQVLRRIGREKGMSAMRSRDSDLDSTEISSPKNDVPSVPSSATDGGIGLDTSFDKSFMYAHEDYMLSATEDAFANIYFPPAIVEHIEQAKLWISMGDWYLDRSIPWRRGWLLHGPGGTGKSSLAKGVAQTLKLPIYQYYLATMSDQEFISSWERMDTPCIALFEDFDNVFHGREPQTEHKSLTFDTVLNQISGVGSINGVFLIVTTNKLEHIDPAMGVDCEHGGISSRPGRIDVVIEISYMEIAERRKLAHRILRDWPEVIEQLVIAGDKTTPAQFEEMCIQRAYVLMAEQKLPVLV